MVAVACEKAAPARTPVSDVAGTARAVVTDGSGHAVPADGVSVCEKGDINMLQWLSSLVFGDPSKRKSNRSKQSSKRAPGRAPPERGGNNSSLRTTPEERKHIVDLYKRGLSMHEIAEQVERSSRTVYAVLTQAGVHRERDNASAKKHTHSGRESQHTRDQYQGDGRRKEPRKILTDRLLEAIEPQLRELLMTALDDKALGLAIVERDLGVRVPKRTVRDRVEEYVGEDSQLLQRLGDEYVERQLRGSRTELDIVREGVTMLLDLAERLNTLSWPRVVDNAVTSGEVGKTLIELIRAFRPVPAPVQGEPDGEASTRSEPNPEAQPSIDPASTERAESLESQKRLSEIVGGLSREERQEKARLVRELFPPDDVLSSQEGEATGHA